jgi:leucyl-tRNA synthetase
LGGERAVIDSGWPIVDESALVQENVQIIAQVNGKLRAKIIAPLDSDNQTIQETALTDEKIEKFTTNKQILKVIVVPNKLINIVVKD